MAFCSNCGEKLKDGVKFCSNCGTSTEQGAEGTSQRKTVYDGEIHKCPNCGETLGSFLSNCSVCGYEIRGAKSASSVKEFAEKLEAIEKNREDKKVKWFEYALNPLSKVDEQRVSLIRNFSIPNTKEDIIEFLILASTNIDTGSWFEARVITPAKEAESSAWMAKFEQAYQKAELLFGQDPDFNKFRKIYEKKTSASKRKKWQPLLIVAGILPFIIILSVVCFYFSPNSPYNAVETVGNEMTIEQHQTTMTDSQFKPGSYESMDVKNFSFDIPNYWEEEGSKNEFLQYYAETGDKVVMLNISYPAETDPNYDVSFDGLIADNENMIKSVASMFTDGDVVDDEIYESDYGVKGVLYRFTYSQEMDWFKKAEGSGYCFCFPSERDRRWFFVIFVQTDNVNGDEYKDDYMKMLANIKEKT